MRTVLRSVWDEPRPPDAPVRVRRDWALLAVLVPAVVLEGVLHPDLDWRVLQTAVAAGLVPLLLWRRTRPLRVLLIAFGVAAVVPLVIGGPLELTTMASMILLPYSVCRWGSGREAVLGAAVVCTAVLVSTALGDLGAADTIGATAVVSAALASGAALRYRDRARARELDQAKLRERERLARDLHDTVAHHVSAMAIRAQAGLATAAARPDAAADALRVIEQEASRTLAEMRAIVRVLRRDQPAELAPGPRIADISLLAERAGPGPPVEVAISGAPDDVEPPVAAAVYRLAQESVTNARRHARRATRIEVSVAADEDAVRLLVTDDGEAVGVRPAVLPGYGLMGMIERAGLLGGVCEAGPGPERGWTVRAELPRDGWAP